MKQHLTHSYQAIISLENLTAAWNEFLVGKTKKTDVQLFARNLMDNILALHDELVNKAYQHGGYEGFFVNDTKRRHIHKANVRDRLLHHAIYRILYPVFDKKFIADSYSCRLGKGTYKAIARFRSFGYKVSKNHMRTGWVLKCDVRKFFASIDHVALLHILSESIADNDTFNLLKNVIQSFSPGLPLGNLTSQLLANVYMDVFDQWMKHTLKVKYYIRYADDFVVFSENKSYLIKILPEIKIFLGTILSLELHPNKISLETLASGIDFLGWVHFSDHRILRKTTKHRLLKRIKQYPTPETFQSYLGLLKHGNSYKLRQDAELQYWLWQ